MDEATTTILVPVSLRDRLAALKSHSRQAYHEVIANALNASDRSLQAAMPPGRLDPLIAANRERLVQAARSNGIERLWVFGSRARGDAGPDSDVDLLYELQPGKSLWDVAGFYADAQEILGCGLDVVQRSALKGKFRDAVAKEAIPL